ncbi:hypothetical protein C0Z01_00505 [Photobacterium kishitanii]|uniref:phage adaptor protein n=1 Tax=Photobacterium kishitanii TaxID=318456 RepID=UPI0007EFEBD7|nr:DUF6682 family protein [Photobacterium kishitanii]OBU29321.1 hypothetical protein AYY22_02045 [Photobacterium kishitanii]PSW71515.1 hypothetical protein C0Z01_00505 [Photobacterium kishitanii]
MISVNTLLTQAATVLVDPLFVRWTKPELLYYLNEALSAVITYKPSAVVARANIEVVRNPVSLPDDAHMLLSIEQIGAVRGPFTPIETLDRFYPDWRTSQGQPKCWTKATDELTWFWLYPAPDKPTLIKVQYSQLLTATEGSDLRMAIIYSGMLLDFMLYRAFSKDAENASEAQKAATHYQTFNAALTGKVTTDRVKQRALKQAAIE